MSHAWPIVLILVVLFGGGFVRSILRAFSGGLAVASRSATIAAAVAELSELQTPQSLAQIVEIAEALEAPVVPKPKRASAPKQRREREVRPAGDSGYGTLLAPRPRLEPLHRLAVVPPIEPLAARAPLAPLTHARI